MIITPALVLEWNADEAPTVGDYFVSGGSLAAIVGRVKELIAQQGFAADFHLRSLVRRRLDDCVKYVEQHPQIHNESVFTRIFQLFSSAKQDNDYLKEAQVLWGNLSNAFVSPLIVPLIAAPGKTLQEVVNAVVVHVLNSELYNANGYYRGDLRSRIYELAKQEWDYQYSSVGGAVRRTTDYVRSLMGKRSVFEVACQILRHIDMMDGKIIQPPQVEPGIRYRDPMVEELCFKNAAWLTDEILYDFATKMTSVKLIKIVGCFQVTQEGISRAVHSRDDAVKKYGYGQGYALDVTTDISEDWVVVKRHDYVG